MSRSGSIPIEHQRKWVAAAISRRKTRNPKPIGSASQPQGYRPTNGSRKKTEQIQRTETWTAVQVRLAGRRITRGVRFIAERVIGLLAAPRENGIPRGREPGGR